MPIEQEVKFRYGAKWLVVLLAAVGALSAQQTVPPTSVTITQAVEDALRNYPSIRVTQEQMNAAAAGIRLAQTAQSTSPIRD